MEGTAPAKAGIGACVLGSKMWRGCKVALEGVVVSGIGFFNSSLPAWQETNKQSLGYNQTLSVFRLFKTWRLAVFF